ncbi:MAG: hypothetical protein H7Z43_02450, partial [Clostridia bacterium]|nr:hypothetical protein [Deltaproteobacteria bacterium]
MKAFVVVANGLNVTNHEKALTEAGYQVVRVSEVSADSREESLTVVVRDDGVTSPIIAVGQPYHVRGPQLHEAL